MRTRWIGIAGLLALLASLMLGTVGPRLAPTAFWGSRSAGALGFGMMGPGMMGGMMGPGMMDGMMGGQIAADPDRPFDQRFLDQMIMHHQGAVMMAQHMIADSQRPELRDLAQRITTTQQREIAQMRQWRREWYAVPGASTMQEAMMEQMVQGGMMDRAQMRQVMGANADFDRMFLQMMIPHHEVAITMAEQALEQAAHPELKTLAQMIITTQRAEIEEMRGYLQTWYGTTQ